MRRLLHGLIDLIKGIVGFTVGLGCLVVFGFFLLLLPLSFPGTWPIIAIIAVVVLCAILKRD